MRPTAARRVTSSRDDGSSVQDRGSPAAVPAASSRSVEAGCSAEAGGSAISRLSVRTIQPSLKRSCESRSNRQLATTFSSIASGKRSSGGSRMPPVAASGEIEGDAGPAVEGRAAEDGGMEKASGRSGSVLTPKNGHFYPIKTGFHRLNRGLPADNRILRGFPNIPKLPLSMKPLPGAPSQSDDKLTSVQPGPPPRNVWKNLPACPPGRFPPLQRIVIFSMNLPGRSPARVDGSAASPAFPRSSERRHATCMPPVFLDNNSQSETESVNCRPQRAKMAQKTGADAHLDLPHDPSQDSPSQDSPSPYSFSPYSFSLRPRLVLDGLVLDGLVLDGRLLTGWFRRLDSWCREVRAPQANVRPCGARRCKATFRRGKSLDPWPFRPVRCLLERSCPLGNFFPRCSSACLRGPSSPEAFLPRPRIAGRPDDSRRLSGPGWQQPRPMSPPRKKGSSGDAPVRPTSHACSLDPPNAPGTSGGWKRRTTPRPAHASA